MNSMSRHTSESPPYRSSQEPNTGTYGAFQLQLVVERQEKRRLEEEAMQLKIALEEETRRSRSFEERWRTATRECEEMEDLFVRQSHSKVEAVRETGGVLSSELESLQRELEVTRHALMDANDALGEERRKREGIEVDSNTSQRFIRGRYDTAIDMLQINAEEATDRGRLERQANFGAWSLLTQMVNDVAFEYSVAIRSVKASLVKEASRRESTEVLSRSEYENKVSLMQRAIGELNASVDQGDKSILDLHKALEKERHENEKLRETVTEMRGNNQTLREQLSSKTERAMLQEAITKRTIGAEDIERSMTRRRREESISSHHQHLLPSSTDFTSQRRQSTFDARDVSPSRHNGGARSSSLYTPIDASILSPPPRGPIATRRESSIQSVDHSPTRARPPPTLLDEEVHRLRSDLAQKDTEISRLLDANTLHGNNVHKLQKERDGLKSELDAVTRENAVLSKSIATVARNGADQHTSSLEDAADRAVVSSIRNRYASSYDAYEITRVGGADTATSRPFEEAGWSQQVMVLSKDVNKLRKDNAQLKELLRIQETQLTGAQHDSVPREVHTSEVRKWKKFVSELQQGQEDLEGQLNLERQRSKKLQKRLDDALSDPTSTSLEKLQRKHDLLITEMSEVKAENATLKAMQQLQLHDAHNNSAALLIRSRDEDRERRASSRRHYHTSSAVEGDEDGVGVMIHGSSKYGAGSTTSVHRTTSSIGSKHRDPLDHHHQSVDPYFSSRGSKSRANTMEIERIQHPRHSSYFSLQDSNDDDADLVKDIQSFSERNAYLERVLERQEAQAKHHSHRAIPSRTSPPRSPASVPLPVSRQQPQASTTTPTRRSTVSSSKTMRYDNVTDSPPRPRPLTGQTPELTATARRLPTHTAVPTAAAHTPVNTTQHQTVSSQDQRTPLGPGRRVPPSSGIVGSEAVAPTVGITPLPPAHIHRLPGGSPEATKRFQAAQPNQLSESLQHQFQRPHSL